MAAKTGLEEINRGGQFGTEMGGSLLRKQGGQIGAEKGGQYQRIFQNIMDEWLYAPVDAIRQRLLLMPQATFFRLTDMAELSA